VDLSIFVHGAFALLGFLGEKVSTESLLMCDLSSTGYLEPFFGAGIGLYLWHLIELLCDTLLASRTGGHFWGHLGNRAWFHFLNIPALP